MSITLAEVAAFHHRKLSTVGSKLIYMAVRSEADRDGWATISLDRFSRLTALTQSGVRKALRRLATAGVIEIRHNTARHSEPNSYRIVTN